MKKGFVYCLICPKTKKPKYVGQTIRLLEMRLEEHKYKKDQTKTHKYNWIEDLKNKNLLEELSIWKLGEYNVDIIDNMESYWIKFFESQNIKLTNSVKGGGFGGYREWKKEANESRSIKQKGKNQKQRSEETKRKLQIANTGKTRSAESIAKSIAGCKGQKRTVEQLERIKENSGRKKGFKQSPEHRAKILATKFAR